MATPDRGFLTALRTIPAGKVFVLFGAGGAARAIAVETTARRGGLYHDREP
jgi:shikimate 5-dehydrogenase